MVPIFHVKCEIDDDPLIGSTQSSDRCYLDDDWYHDIQLDASTSIYIGEDPLSSSQCLSRTSQPGEVVGPAVRVRDAKHKDEAFNGNLKMNEIEKNGDIAAASSNMSHEKKVNSFPSTI